MRARVVVAALAFAASWSCASSGTSASASGAGRGPSRSADIIAQEEITTRAADASNALQVIQKLRPAMLRSRGSSDMTGGTESLPRVYVDNISYGGLDALTNIQSNQIKEIRFVSPRDATTQWGTGHMGGVILVLTRSR